MLSCAGVQTKGAAREGEGAAKQAVDQGAGAAKGAVGDAKDAAKQAAGQVQLLRPQNLPNVFATL